MRQERYGPGNLVARFARESLCLVVAKGDRGGV